MRSTVGTSANPLSAWNGEEAIRAAVELWKFEAGKEGRQYPRKPDDIQTALLAIRLYCEREGQDFATLVAGLQPITR
jgi:hypothetical protein